jgi:hypothetical protein
VIDSLWYRGYRRTRSETLEDFVDKFQGGHFVKLITIDLDFDEVFRIDREDSSVTGRRLVFSKETDAGADGELFERD